MRHNARVQERSARSITLLHVVAAVACALALAIDMIEMAIGSVLATLFSEPSSRMNSGDLSWLLSAVYLGAVLGAPIIGSISDRRGIRSCLAASLGWLALTSCLAGASATVLQLSVFRFLSGLSLGAIPPLLIAYLTRIAPVRYRGAFIFWVCGSAALVPPFALLLIRSVIRAQPMGVEGWRWPLYGAGVLALVAGAVLARLPESHAWPASESGRTGAPEVSGRSAGDVGVRGSRSRFTFVACIYFLIPWATVGFPLLTGPILLRQGYDLDDALLYVTLATVGPSIASFATTSFVDRFDRRVILAGCALLMIGAVATFAMAQSSALCAGALVVFGIAAALYVTALTIYAAEIFPSAVRTFATSSAWAINRAASAIVPLTLVPLVGAHGVVTSLLPICAALGASVLLIGVRSPSGAARRAVG
jgi:MFS transporter, putative metabolite:H+ symporter